MPSFFAPSLHGLPTPPYVNGGSRMDADQRFYVTEHSAFPPRYPQSGCEFIEQYSACYAKPGAMNVHPQAIHPMRNGRELAAAQTMQAHQGAPQALFGPLAAAPVLPPIRPSVQLPSMDSAIPPQYRRQELLMQPEQQPKEEKATGGVAAHLDYEMDQMTDFVAEMAQGMYALYITKINLADIDLVRSVYPGTPVPPQFRKYVSQILSSTRLPSSTILLGLYYLATRMRMLSSAGIYASGSGQVYRMLTIALLLGSKFLDDNTFQNRSWAEVSNIPVAELNAMELDWLFAFDWKLHERIHNKQDGFATWRSHWENWRAKAAARASESRHKLAPIDTNIPRQHVVSKPLLSPEGPIPPQYQRGVHFDNTWLNPAASEYSPPSAPHSGPNTPDYYTIGPWGYANPTPPYSRAWVPPHQQYISQPAPRSQPPSYHQTPSYSLPFAQNIWTGHGSSCGCLYCAKHHEHYVCANAFGAIQPVVAG
ncbi:putative cyclin-like protein [Thermoascus aurantiacus ATCC 26904]